MLAKVGNEGEKYKQDLALNQGLGYGSMIARVIALIFVVAFNPDVIFRHGVFLVDLALYMNDPFADIQVGLDGRLGNDNVVLFDS